MLSHNKSLSVKVLEKKKKGKWDGLFFSHGDKINQRLIIYIRTNMNFWKVPICLVKKNNRNCVYNFFFWEERVNEIGVDGLKYEMSDVIH